jgi:hypothetical protein
MANKQTNDGNIVNKPIDKKVLEELEELEEIGNLKVPAGMRSDAADRGPGRELAAVAADLEGASLTGLGTLDADAELGPRVRLQLLLLQLLLNSVSSAILSDSNASSADPLLLG